MKYITGLLFCLIVVLSSCGSAKKSTGTAAVNAPQRVLPALPSSQINIPIKVYMRPLIALMDSVTAKEFTNEKWPEYTESSCDFRYKYRFTRSPFTFSCVNNKVTIGFRGNYQIAGSKRVCAFNTQVSPWVGGSCGFGSEPLRRVDITIGSQLDLLTNHQIRTNTRLETSRALDKCAVTVLQTDVTTQVMDSIKASIDSYCAVFDSIVQAVNNNVLLQNWRKGGSKVMAISQYGFINLNPTQFRVGRFNTYKDTLIFSVGFSGSPRFSSDSQQLVTNAPLPAIHSVNTATGISTYLDANYQYSFFNKLLNDSLRNKPFELEGRTFVVRDVVVAGTDNGKLSVDVSFTGNRKGTLHIAGTPVLDTALQVLSMPDISFSIDTRDMLVNILKNMFRKKIMKELKSQSVLDIAALIQRNKPGIEARLNQPVTAWMSTSGKIHEIRLLGILPQKNSIQVQAFIRADLQLTGAPSMAMLKGF
ncbi:MAG: DUF4403 family protein [Chitinophagaceae bacterium]|nr:DUF4403 family protein [Chitinophagaceae bacterium]